MSYCVQCGVSLDDTAAACPLCQTPVLNPNQPVDGASATPFPMRRSEVEPVSRTELAILLTVMLLSIAVLCAVINFFFLGSRPWSLYVIGAAVTVWLWLVLPLILTKMPRLVRLAVCILAVALYVLLISFDLNGFSWYIGLALPIIFTGGALLLALGLGLQPGRSILSGTTAIIGAVGIFLVLVEVYVDRWNDGFFKPGWSVVVATICVALMIPLIVVRRRPALRDAVRRRFHV